MPDRILLNEPIGTERETVVQLFSGGSPVSGVTLSTASLLIAKAGGNMVASAGATLTEITGGATTDGLYRLRFAQGDVDTVGDLAFELVSTSAPSFVSFQAIIPVIPWAVPVLRYNLARSGSSNTIQLDAGASSTDSFFCGGGRDCMVRIVSGTGANQVRRGISYVGATQTMTVSFNWITNPDSTSVFEVSGLLEGGLDSATITSIQSGLATSSALSTVNTTVNTINTNVSTVNTTVNTINTNVSTILTNTGRIIALMQDNSMIDNITWATDNVITNARVRTFASASALSTATPGNPSFPNPGNDGEIYSYSITAVDVGSGQYSSLRKSRTL